MVAKKEVTAPEWQRLREMAREGRTKSYAAKQLDIPVGRLNASADRTGRRQELDRLFPGARSTFVMTDERFGMFVELSKFYGVRAACSKMVTTPQSAKAAAHEAGCLAEFCALFPRVRKRTVKPAAVMLPRDLDPAVKSLTREWRVAA